MKPLFVLFLSVFICNKNIFAQTTIVKDPTIEQMVKEISPDSLRNYIQTMVNFGTRNTLSTQAKTKRGIGAARLYVLSKFKQFAADITQFYKARNYTYAWFDEKGMIEPANNLYNLIQNISEEGLPDSMPYKVAFINLMEKELGNNSININVELMLTYQYVAYAKTVWVGLSEKQSLSTEWLLPRKKITTKQMLDSLIDGNKILDNAPIYRQYSLLKEQLKKYYHLQTTEKWLPIKMVAKRYTSGDSMNEIQKIRKRLFLLGDISANNQSMLFDDVLYVGVKNLQRRFGYKEDGIITSSLLAEINYPLIKRIEDIIVNMERARWVPIQLKKDYLLINIPAYKLYAYENDSLVFNMNVVVGKDQHKTVIFNGDMKYIVFSPYWNIPPSIIKNETLPALKKNSNYLETHNMEWNNGSIRQKPGPNNSLGSVKFLFPNTHSIYLHDTPAKSLFNEDNRAFSHGCIRLAEPKKLAVYLLKNDSLWNKKNITDAMNSGIERYVTLKKTVPVFIAYFTTWIDKEGKLNFRKDIYSRNSRLAKMILKKPAI